jgi:hypothetical protein
MAYEEGAVVEMLAEVRDIDDGNEVIFQLWREGQDPDSGIPVGVARATIQNSMAKSKCHLQFPGSTSDDPDLKFFFTVHSAWCRYKRSELFTVELIRPKITKITCQDMDGNEVDKILIGKPMQIVAEGNEDMEEGVVVTFGIYPEGCDTKKYRPFSETTVKYTDGKAVAKFEYQFKPDRENPPTKKHKLFITANSQRCKEVRSELVEVSVALRAYVYRKHGIPLKNTEFHIKGHGDNSFTVTTDETGYFEKMDCIPQLYTLQIPGQEKMRTLSNDKVTKIILGDSVILSSE